MIVLHSFIHSLRPSFLPCLLAHPPFLSYQLKLDTSPRGGKVYRTRVDVDELELIGNSLHLPTGEGFGWMEGFMTMGKSEDISRLFVRGGAGG